jgi:hypothetical protein
MNGNVGSRGDIQTNGTVGINGDAYSGSQTIFSTATTVTGTVTVDGSDFPALPTPTAFTSGGTDYIGSGNNGTVSLAPNVSYGELSGGGGWNINLSSGTYYFDSIHFANNTNINLDLSGGAINIFVTGELWFGSGADVNLTNGGDSSMVYWETHEADTLNAFRATGGSDWLGTVYAPYGGIHFGSGSGPTTFEGHFWSGWDGTYTNLSGNLVYERSVYIEHGVTGNLSPIPVPAAVWLFGSGLLGLVGIARRRKTA